MITVYRQNKFKRRAETFAGTIVSNAATFDTDLEKKTDQHFWWKTTRNTFWICTPYEQSWRFAKFILDEYITYVVGIKF